jgi:hypothetical protein
MFQIGLILTIACIFIAGCNRSKNDIAYSEEFVEAFLTDYYEVTEEDKDRVSEIFDVNKVVRDDFFENYYNQMLITYEKYLEIDLIDQLAANRAIDNVDKFTVIEDKDVSIRDIHLSLDKEDLTRDEKTRFLYDYSVELEVRQNNQSENIKKEGKIRVYKTETNWIIDHVDFQMFPIIPK